VIPFFKARPDEGNVQWLSYRDRPGEEFPWERLMSSEAGDGRPWGDEPLVAIARTGDSGEPLTQVPMPWLGSYTIAFEGEAIERARPVLEPHCELRMLPTEDGTRVAVVVPPLVKSALDMAASDVILFPSSDRIMTIRKLALSDRAESFGVLRLAEHSRGPTYYRQDIVDDLDALGVVRGTHFRRAT